MKSKVGMKKMKSRRPITTQSKYNNKQNVFFSLDMEEV